MQCNAMQCNAMQCNAIVCACTPAGLEELWNNSTWQDMVGPDGLRSSSSSSSSPVMTAPLVDHAAMQQPGAGAKRGLLEAVLQLSVPPEVGGVCDGLFETGCPSCSAISADTLQDLWCSAKQLLCRRLV
jgi:hypothetical protein